MTPLQDSLGGESKALMFAAISAIEPSTEETMTTLNFASRVKEVELNVGKEKSSNSASDLTQLKKMLEKAKDQVYAKTKRIDEMADEKEEL